MEADAEPGPAPAKRKRLSRKAQLRELAKVKKEIPSLRHSAG